MDDRELLELAAKAHGFIDDAKSDSAEHGLHRTADGRFYVTDKDGWRYWLPLDYDDEALRLAVKLRLAVLCNEGCAVVERAMDECTALEEFGTDPCAATRRAIVRAAAEIGRDAKESGNG